MKRENYYAKELAKAQDELDLIVEAITARLSQKKIVVTSALFTSYAEMLSRVESQLRYQKEYFDEEQKRNDKQDELDRQENC